MDWSQAELHKSDDGIISLTINTPGQTLIIHAQRFIFTAGKGNAQLLQQLGLNSPAMQLRPLQQVMVKHPYPFDFYGHCLGRETTPRLTISSHRLPDGTHVWYLGGSLAERGAHMAAEELIALAQQELEELIPWIDLQNAEWATLPVERAEPLQANFARPDNAFIAPAPGAANLLVGWPTKLTLAPNLANQALEILQSAAIQTTNNKIKLHDYLAYAELAKTPWELAFPPAIAVEEALALRFREPDEDNE